MPIPFISAPNFGSTTIDLTQALVLTTSVDDAYPDTAPNCGPFLFSLNSLGIDSISTSGSELTFSPMSLESGTLLPFQIEI